MHLEPPAFRSHSISLTSLIDVIFLLLLFFMLTSTFTRFTAIELGATGGGRSAQANPLGLVISLRAENMLVNGVAVETDLYTRLADYKSKGETRVLILTGVGGTSQQLVTVLEASRRAGLSASVAR